MAPLSLAVATFSPVDTRFCTAVSWAEVALSVSSAVSAAAFVLMLVDTGLLRASGSGL